MKADIIQIERKSTNHNGIVECPMTGNKETENTCCICRYLRIAEYDTIKCLYRQIEEARSKGIRI